MSLPTLWVNADYNRDVLKRPGAMVRAYVTGLLPKPGEVAYVPASALDAANEELRAANEENERLRAQVSNAVANLEEAQRLFASIRQADALASWACESEPGEESFDEQVREMLHDLEKITGFAARQRAERAAALAPKES